MCFGRRTPVRSTGVARACPALASQWRNLRRRNLRAPTWPARAAVSPSDGSLLARVHGFLRAALEQEAFHVARQERARLRVHEIQPVVVDQHRLLLQPLRPTFRADFRLNARTDGTREWRTFESRARVAAAGAGNVH